MAQLAVVLPYLAIAGAGLSAYSIVQEGRTAKDAADLQGDLLERRGNEEAAAGQRAAEEERRQGRLATSRATAVAAASGAKADDPTVLDVTGKLESQSEYNALSRLYAGQGERQNLNLQAKATRSMGKQARNQSILKATGTLLQSGSSLYDRYGKKAPNEAGANRSLDSLYNRPGMF